MKVTTQKNNQVIFESFPTGLILVSLILFIAGFLTMVLADFLLGLMIVIISSVYLVVTHKTTVVVTAVYVERTRKGILSDYYKAHWDEISELKCVLVGGTKISHSKLSIIQNNDKKELMLIVFLRNPKKNPAVHNGLLKASELSKKKIKYNF
jgi:hypothetical protein